MNKPMTNTEKSIYAKQAGIVIPARVKKLLLGAEIVWWDENPMSQDMDETLHFFFESHTNPMTDLLLKKYGITDVAQYVNIAFRWSVHMELYYETPNNKEKKAHIDHHYFEFHGTIFPMSEKFKKERDTFYLMKNLEHLMVPEDNRNKGYYKTTKFSAQVIGI